MSLTSYLNGLYSLDTLDKRFTASVKSQGVGRELGDARARRYSRGDARSRTAEASSGASPSRWRTSEFYVYYGVFLICVPLMFKAGYDASLPSHPNYKNYEDLLSDGWIPGRKVDNSDTQYSFFRNNLHYLLILFLVHPVLRKVYDQYFPVKTRYTSNPSSNSNGSAYPAQASQTPSADARLRQRARYDLGFALFLLCVLHGFSIVKILIISSVNYLIATKLPRSYVVPLTWLYNVFVLFANELCRGYSFTSIANITLTFTVWDPNSNWGTFCDEHSGLISRWEVLFNITILRLISFNMDSHWSGGREGGATLLEKKQLDPSNLTDRDRVSYPASHDDYTFCNYLAYALYSPLYLAGPILTFNEYISQARYPPRSISPGRTIQYGVRFLVCLLTMELLLHYIYAVAISHAPRPAWHEYSPLQLSMLGFFHLHIIWLKLLLPWRFFRLWALADGVDPPENMVRCMSDNYSALAFWRGWHRSLNRWIVRYIFIPLGGSGPGASGRARPAWLGVVRTVVNYLAVFTFVALWHDIQLRLLMWGWLVTFFFLPEVLATLAFPARKWQHRPNAYRVICGIGAVGNILMMMVANLVGFAIGLDGLKGLVHGIVGSFSGLLYLVVACAALFVGVQVMFEVREEELRHGIKMKC